MHTPSLTRLFPWLKLREDRDGWRAIAIEQQKIIVRLSAECAAYHQCLANRADDSGPLNPDTIEQVISVISAIGLRRRAVLEPDSTLEGDLGLDSIDREYIALGCEDAFSVEIADHIPPQWQTVADIARTVDQLRAGAA